MTTTTVGWALADRPDTNGTDGTGGADGAVLARDEFTVGRHCDGNAAVNTAAQAAAMVQQLRTAAEAQGRRLSGIGVTWSADAAAEAALLMESLTEAGFDDVLPVRFPQAAEASTSGADIAVCVIESALRPCAGFAVAQLDETPGNSGPADFAADTAQPRALSYAGAVTMLVAGVLTFVVSLSAALSLQLVPAKGPGSAEQTASGSVASATAPVAAPAVAPPPVKAPAPPAPETPTAFGSLWEIAPDGGAAEPAGPVPPQPSRSRALLNRVLEHIPSLPGH